MWEKIKNFFKWIADHTGISWIARKISSGWKWLFGGKANTTQQNTSQHEERSDNEKQEPAQANDQSKDHTTPKTLDDEVNPDKPAAPDKPQGPVINTSETDAKELPENFPTPNLKVGDGGKLLLTLTPEQLAKCKENSEATRLNALLIYIKCDANEYRITGNSVDEKIISIESIQKKNENGQFKKISAKEILGNAMVKKVDSISNRAFEAPTLEQPKLNTTTTQQVVNNDSNKEIAAEEHASSSTTTGLTEQLPEVNSTQELSTPNNEPVKIDTSDQSIPPAAPDEPQRPVINTSETDAKELPENFPTSNPKNADSNVLKGASNENYLKVEEIPNSEKSKRESSTINVFNGNLELLLADDIQQKLEDYKHPRNNGKYRMEIHCKEGKFNINFFKMDNADGSLTINTLQKIGNNQLLSDTSKIKKSLGLKKQVTSVEIDFICKYQSVESLKLKVPTNVPSSEIASSATPPPAAFLSYTHRNHIEL
ncbi:hypothetical protein [Wolbachia endosymbiont of Oedothorax gibbosus]|uniref:hypothetical protein n=1 Tax=Wolbachia endosymbiont of Oedothorax gibbosus TaxID=931100 RepID=UPI002023EC42|nr:hypothetical protein [Wolbachia endosymbiont of Oedothorax gibbosus]